MPIYSKALVLLVAALGITLTGCNVAVLTYHNDNFRTGWNKHERELTYSTVNESSLTSVVVPLDDQVDAQPLVVPGVKITAGPNRGKKGDVVYVATANNSVYAIDAATGQILLQQNFGPPVEAKFLAAWPNSVAGPCGDNGPNVGITGTPVIDRAKKRMYFITYTLETDGPTYKIHALDLGSLTEPIAAQKITASHQLNDHKPFPFQATYQRQRPGLLLTHGVIYAGFGSFCDWGGAQSRGWVLGWKADSLDPLPSNQLNDRLDDPQPAALSSVWMSGYGLAADESGSPYFVTGNSWDLGSYDGINNIQESVVKSSQDLTHFTVFTPSNAQTSLDPSDGDLGSGGVLLIPSRVGSRSLAAAAGKDGRMFILDRNNLGGYTPGGPDKVVYTVPAIGACWCGQSYFNDGSPHIVSSGGTNVKLWGFQTSPQITLVGQGSSEDLPSASVGFFTSVSSQRKSNGIIWAVSRPDMRNSSGPPLLWLYAFKAVPDATSNLPELFHALAGMWSPTAVNGANSSSVPVVANGKVYVGSYKELAIFGLNLPGGKKTHEWTLANETGKQLGAEQHEVDGTLTSVEGGRLRVRDKTGKMIEVDATVAIREYHSVPLVVGRAVHLVGTYDSAGVLHVASMLRGKM